MRLVLSISILASRNEKEVRRCLESLAPIRKQLPCEIIAVDTTGGDEAIAALCREFADKVVDFAWCDDFSKARNAGLSLAKGEWFLYVDDDEWFEDVGPLVDFFRSGEYRDYGAADYIQRNFSDWGFRYYNDAWASRMIRLDEGTRFFGKIHEYLGPLRGKRKNLRLIANHTGYIALTDEDRQRKFDRNYPLLLEMMRSEPDVLRWRAQAVQELHIVRHWEDMKELCVKSLEALKGDDSPGAGRGIGTFYAGLIESCARLGDEKAAVRAEAAAKADRRTTRACHARGSIELGRMYFGMRKWEEAREQFLDYGETVKYYEAHPREWEEEGENLILVSNIMQDVSKSYGFSFEMGYALAHGDLRTFEENYEKLGWTRDSVYFSDELVSVFAETMAARQQEPVLDRAMQDLWDNPVGSRKLFAQIEACRNRDEKSFWRLLEATARMDGDFWYIYYAKILSADREGADADYTELFKGFCIRTPNVLMTPPEITGAVRRHGGSLSTGYSAVPFDKWAEDVAAYEKDAALSDLLRKEKEIEDIPEGDDLRLDCALMSLSRARVLTAGMYAPLKRAMMDYGQRAAAFSRKYFTREVAEDYPELLPDMAYCGVCIWRAFQQGTEDGKEEIAYFDLAAQRDAELATPLLAFVKLRRAAHDTNNK
ncbi:MAG: glycosyltransferase [Clostridiales bacterium]|nr:glycosyltransferase [Clostridiales bacterium]